MSHPYFFIDRDNVCEGRTILSGDDFKHLKNSLRAKKDTVIELSDSYNSRYIAKVISIGKKAAELEMLSSKKIAKKKPHITLFQCILKKNAMEYVIEKAAEIGAERIVPLKSKRVVVQEKKATDKNTRWQKIAREASKQSKRDFICEVDNAINLKDVDAKIFDVVFMPYEEEKKIINLNEIFKAECKYSDVALIVGPEGGFEKDEVDYFRNINATVLSLGSNILKAQTASVYFLSVLDYFLKNLVEDA